MSKIQDDISVNFNLVKREINNEESKEIKPKAKRASKKIIVEDIKPVEPVETVEPVEDIEELKPKPKPKRESKKNIVQPIEEVEEPIQPVEEVIKPKPKRTSKKNINIIVEDIKPVELVEDIKPVVEIEDIEEIPKNIKTLEMVQCEKCNKQMTKNTLRYHHDKNCKGKPIDKKLPVKRRIKQEPKVEPKIEAKQPTYRDKLNECLKKKSESISKLALQIA